MRHAQHCRRHLSWFAFSTPTWHSLVFPVEAANPKIHTTCLLAAAADSEFPNTWQTRQVAVVVAFSSRTCIRVGETLSTCSCSPSPSCGPTTRGAAAMIIPVCSIILIGPGKRKSQVCDPRPNNVPAAYGCIRSALGLVWPCFIKIFPLRQAVSPVCPFSLRPFLLRKIAYSPPVTCLLLDYPYLIVMGVVSSAELSFRATSPAACLGQI